jgi:hypothetical protein
MQKYSRVLRANSERLSCAHRPSGGFLLSGSEQDTTPLHTYLELTPLLQIPEGVQACSLPLHGDELDLARGLFVYAPYGACKLSIFACRSTPSAGGLVPLVVHSFANHNPSLAILYSLYCICNVLPKSSAHDGSQTYGTIGYPLSVPLKISC